jgi:hypothetical protein
MADHVIMVFTMRVSAPAEGGQEWGRVCPSCQGVVRTFRDEARGSQEFFAHNYKILFARVWDADAEEWEEWTATQLW